MALAILLKQRVIVMNVENVKFRAFGNGYNVRAGDDVFNISSAVEGARAVGRLTDGGYNSAWLGDVDDSFAGAVAAIFMIKAEIARGES